jgi:hypothetical protein
MCDAEKILSRTAVCAAITIVLFLLAMTEYSKFSYVPTYCFVKASFLRNCSAPLIRNESDVKRCFLPVWLIEHKVSGKTKQATIIGPEFLVHYGYVGNDTKIMKLYKVFIWTCKQIKSLLHI